MDNLKQAAPIRDRVKNVAREQLKNGLKPSQNSVRSELGGTSNSTITEALREFWLEIGTELTNIDSAPGMPDELVKGMRDWWQLAREAANATAEARYVKAIEIETRAREAAIEAQRQVDTLSHQLTLATEKLNSAETLLAKEKHTSSELNALLASAQQQNSRLNIKIDELHEQQNNARALADQRYDRLMAQYEALQTDKKLEISELKASFNREIERLNEALQSRAP